MAERARDRYERRQRTVALADKFVVITETGELQIKFLGVWNTEAAARSVATMHFHDTGQLTDVFVLRAPEGGDRG